MLKQLTFLLAALPLTALANEPDPMLFLVNPDAAIAYEKQKPSIGTQTTNAIGSGLDQMGKQLSSAWSGIEAAVKPEPTYSHPVPVAAPAIIPSYMQRPGPAWRQAPPMRNFAGSTYHPGAELFRSTGYGKLSMTAYSSQVYTGMQSAPGPRAPLNGYPIVRDYPNPYEASMNHFWTNSAGEIVWRPTSPNH